MLAWNIPRKLSSVEISSFVDHQEPTGNPYRYEPCEKLRLTVNMCVGRRFALLMQAAVPSHDSYSSAYPLEQGSEQANDNYHGLHLCEKSM